MGLVEIVPMPVLLPASNTASGPGPRGAITEAIRRVCQSVDRQAPGGVLAMTPTIVSLPSAAQMRC